MVNVVERMDGFPYWRLLCCGSPTFPRARRDRRSRVRRTESMIEPVISPALRVRGGRRNGRCNGKREICRERPPGRDVRASG